MRTWQLAKRDGCQTTFLPYVIILEGEQYKLHAPGELVHRNVRKISTAQVMHWFRNPDDFVMETLL